MIVCDEYLAFAAVAGTLPAELDREHLATTHSTYARLLRVIHRLDDAGFVHEGQLSRLVRRLPPDDRSKLVAPDPDLVRILDPRPFLDVTARVSALQPLSWMVAELAAAAIFHGAPLWFGHEQNVPPRVHELLDDGGLTGLHVSEFFSPESPSLW